MKEKYWWWLLGGFALFILLALGFAAIPPMYSAKYARGQNNAPKDLHTVNKTSVQKPKYAIKVIAGYVIGYHDYDNHVYPAVGFIIKNKTDKMINGLAQFQVVFENQKTKTESKVECEKSGPFIPGYKTNIKICVESTGWTMRSPKMKAIVLFQGPNTDNGYRVITKINQVHKFIGVYNSSGDVSYSSSLNKFGKWVNVY